MKKLIITLFFISVMACAGIAYAGASFVDLDADMSKNITKSQGYGVFVHEYKIGSISGGTVTGAYARENIKTSEYAGAYVTVKLQGVDGEYAEKAASPNGPQVYSLSSGRVNTLYGIYMYGSMDIRGASTAPDMYTCELSVDPGN